MRVLRTIVLGIVLGIVGGIGVANINHIFGLYNSENETQVVSNMDEDSVYNSVIRFHIRANSNSEEDQALKLKVKEKVLETISTLVKGSTSIEKTKETLEENMGVLEETALNTIQAEGYDYPVKVYFSREDFPVKEYGGVVFPAGEYEALRIDIGNGSGANWWCVMYPPLCFVDATNVVMSEACKEELANALSEEEYENLMRNQVKNGDVEVELKFKIVEIFK